jgi:hypothetical protein
MAAPLSSSGLTMDFTEGEKVLCYHGPLLYEAKVRQLYVILSPID